MMDEHSNPYENAEENWEYSNYEPQPIVGMEEQQKENTNKTGVEIGKEIGKAIVLGFFSAFWIVVYPFLAVSLVKTPVQFVIAIILWMAVPVVGMAILFIKQEREKRYCGSQPLMSEAEMDEDKRKTAKAVILFILIAGWVIGGPMVVVLTCQSLEQFKIMGAIWLAPAVCLPILYAIKEMICLIKKFIGN